MIPQIGFPELLLVAVLAIIVVGPKDLPLLMRKFGRFVGKIKAMGAEFKDAFDEMGAQAELEELKKEMEELRKESGLDDLDTELTHDIAKLDTDLRRSIAEPAESPKAIETGGADE